MVAGPVPVEDVTDGDALETEPPFGGMHAETMVVDGAQPFPLFILHEVLTGIGKGAAAGAATEAHRLPFLLLLAHIRVVIVAHANYYSRISKGVVD
jgi:hypothetical protein